MDASGENVRVEVVKRDIQVVADLVTAALCFGALYWSLNPSAADQATRWFATQTERFRHYVSVARARAEINSLPETEMD